MFHEEPKLARNLKLSAGLKNLRKILVKRLYS